MRSDRILHHVRIVTGSAVLWMLLGFHWAIADQTAEQLPGLFEELQQAVDPVEVRQIETAIWNQWLIPPDEAAGLLMSQITHAMAQRELDLALLLCNQLLDASPDFSEAWNKRATIHYLQGNFEASVSDIRETLALEPRHFGAISGLGLIFIREKNYEAALKAFEQVLAISPGSVSAQSSVERAKALQGKEI